MQGIGQSTVEMDSIGVNNWGFYRWYSPVVVWVRYIFPF
jgi:hypothetical protein